MFNGAQFKGLHRAFGFCHKENVLDGAFVECDCPVRRIVAYRRGNLEGSGQLSVDTNFLRSIQIFGKLTLNTFFGRAISKHIVLNCLLGKKRLIKALGSLFCRKDRAVVFSLNGIVGDMLHNHSGLLLIDQPDHFRNKLFRVVLEHIELVGTDTLQDGRCRFACELCAIGNFANQIILDLACFRVLEGLCPGLFARKRIAAVNFVLIHVRLLASNGSRVLQFRNKQLFINVGNGLANQLGAVELHRVGILVVNFTPQSLKLFLGKILIQRIFLHLRFVTIGEHILAKFEFPGRKLLFALFTITLLVPSHSKTQPIFSLIMKLNLYDSIWGVTLVYLSAGMAMSIFVLKAGFMAIPKSLDEAATLDGASFFRTFWTINLPLAKSALATAGILMFLGNWNEYYFASLLTVSDSQRTLPIALAFFTSEFSYNYTQLFAALTIVILPGIILYALAQDQVQASVAASGVKG